MEVCIVLGADDIKLMDANEDETGVKNDIR